MMQYFLWVQYFLGVQFFQPEPALMWTVATNLVQVVQISVTLSLTCYTSPPQVITERTIRTPTQPAWIYCDPLPACTGLPPVISSRVIRERATATRMLQ